VEKNEPDEVCVTRNSSGSNPSPGQIGRGLGNSDQRNYVEPLSWTGSISLAINPWRNRPRLGDEQLPAMSACPLAALPNVRLPSATHLMAQWEPGATAQQWRQLQNLYVCAWEPPGHELEAKSARSQ